MKSKIIIFGILLTILSSFVSATCTMTFDRDFNDAYSPSMDIVGGTICTGNNEKNDAYTWTWYNSSNDVVEVDTGNAPSSKNEYFYETYTIPSGYNGNITAILTGGDLEGTDIGNVSGANTNTLLISNVIIGGKWLGLVSSIKGTLKDENDKKVSGASCIVEVYSNDETTIPKKISVESVGGEVHANWIMDYSEFAENTDYKAEIHCFCGDDGSGNECIDEVGGDVFSSDGGGSQPFTTNSWISVLEYPLPITYVNGTTFTNPNGFAGYDSIFFKRNLTNNYGVTLEATKHFYIVNNVTGQLYPYSQISHSTIGTDNTSTIFEYVLPQDLDTGIYYIQAFANIYYYGLLVTTKIIQTDTFTVTSIQDTLTINSITIKDYWGNIVNTSNSISSVSSMPVSNWTSPYTVLTEGFGYQICGNITNSYNDNIYWHMENLVIHNPTSGWTAEEFNKNNGDRWSRVLTSGENDICWYNNLPLTIPTHSDYHFDFDIHIGDEHNAFDCGDKCSFSGETSYIYIGAIEDSIVFDKWIIEPTNSSQGVPAIFIVTEREEYLSMNDDCNYTNQEETDWDNPSFLCNKKNGGGQLILNLSTYPIAGEDFKVCFQTQNYLTDEIDLEFFDIYIDNDEGETVIFWDDETDGYVPSIQSDKLWVSETPSRTDELGGNLIDGYGIMCSKWLNIPLDVQGGNNWDIQGKVRINPDIYNLEEKVIWNWESDEFPIYGRMQGENYLKINSVDLGKANYYTGESLHVCANITNNYAQRLVFDVTYDFRCSEDIYDDTKLDRSTLFSFTEERGVGSGQTQQQCMDFNIPFKDSLRYKTSGCYASVKIYSPFILSNIDIQSSKTSGRVNLTDYGFFPEYELNPEYPLIRLFPDWRRFDDRIDNITKSYYRTKINITKLEEYKLDPNGIIDDDSWDIYTIFPSLMPNSLEIYNYTVEHLNGTTVDNPTENKCVQWKNGDFNSACAIGIEEINLSDTNDDYFVVKVWFEEYDETNMNSNLRSAIALEGIENKTGTFAFNINADATASSPGTINVEVSTLLEISEVDELEGYFSCYIEGYKSLTEIQFEHAINKTSTYITTRTLNIPLGLPTTSIRTAICELGFIAFGNDKDIATDTFLIVDSSSSISSGGQYGSGNFGLTQDTSILEEARTGIGKIKDNSFLQFIFGCVLLIFVSNYEKKKKLIEKKDEEKKVIR